MSQVLGRGESRPWATKWPVSSLGAMLVAVVVGIGIFTYRNVELWTPLQQWYWTEYLTTKSFPTARGDYKLLAKVDAHGKQLMAVDATARMYSRRCWFSEARLGTMNAANNGPTNSTGCTLAGSCGPTANTSASRTVRSQSGKTGSTLRMTAGLLEAFGIRRSRCNLVPAVPLVPTRFI